MPSKEQLILFNETIKAYQNGCNYLSKIVFEHKILQQRILNEQTYEDLRSIFSLRSQMAQSVMKTVVARYKTNKSNGHVWTQVSFKRPEYDLVWNRDYSLTKDGLLSLNTLEGRVKVPYITKGMHHFFDGTWKFGTAKLVNKHKKWFLHIPMTKEFEEFSATTFKNIVGIDLGINFIATSYDLKGETVFFNGKKIKHKRAHYKKQRQELQKCQTPSARRKLKKIGNRENRWMTDVNHQVSKALVTNNGEHTLFVLEDLSGIRNKTEKVRIRNRYVTVSWAFFQLRQMIEYKATMNCSKAITVDPKYTSQKCPKCGLINKHNRNKKTHTFCCKNCTYRSNDDRIGAMNLHRNGIEYISAVTLGV
jgi:IS605 OrfB family transposase